MRTKPPLILRVALAYLVASVALFFYFDALADAGSAPSVVLPPQLLWGLVAAVIAQAATFTLKRVSAWWFFHTAVGSIVLAFLSGALGAVGPVVQTKGFDRYAIIFAVLNFALNFFTTGNATNAAAVEAVKARRVRTTPGGSVGAAKQSALFGLGLVLFMGLGAPTCSPGAQALGACELGKLPQTLETVVATVVAIAADPNSTETDLVSAGKNFAPGQLDCAVAAVSAWLDSQVPSHGQVKLEYVAMQSKLRAYLATHAVKHACAGWPSPKRGM